MRRGVFALAVVTAASACASASADEPKKPKASAKPAAATVTVKATAPGPTVQVSAAPAPPAAQAKAEFLPSAPVEAAAPPPPAANRPGFSLAGVFGFVTSDFGVALGVRAGYTLPLHLYLGAGFQYLFGNDLQHAWLLAPEVGWDFALPGGLPFLLRPYAGVGYAHVFELGLNGSALVVYPGVEFDYDILPNLFAGIDVQVPILSAGGTAALFDGLVTAGFKM